ncbi:hypothetical protein AVEN_225427-1 [Araneus ventricosus]|uniref:Uncharacterized protein n=1 Tax=Araneus ventricosus TaxID=182803 RepID=A0A4Y2V923_ARAVE|nr:hypothetical protein AVEN_225427-1 [Araneus ventricosus]
MNYFYLHHFYSNSITSQAISKESLVKPTIQLVLVNNSEIYLYPQHQLNLTILSYLAKKLVIITTQMMYRRSFQNETNPLQNYGSISASESESAIRNPRIQSESTRSRIRSKIHHESDSWIHSFFVGIGSGRLLRLRILGIVTV